MNTTRQARTIVFVGSRGCGKSTLITACSNFTCSSDWNPKSINDSQDEDLPLVVEPILLEADHDERALPLVLIDTAVGDVVETQDQIKQSDMVVVMAGVGNESDLRDVNNYWIQDQLRSVRAEQPILLILNKVDEVTKEELEQITQKWIKLFQHQLWELHLFVSAKTGEGVENMIEQFSNTLMNCTE